MLAPWKKSYNKPKQHIKADVTLLTKVHMVKAMVFPVVMYRCESWTIKKAECWRTGAFELWCWRRLLRVPWTARRSNQSILKEINLEYSLEGLMLRLRCNTLATWCEEPTHWKRPWCWERLKAGGEGDDRGWDGWMASLRQWTWVWTNSGRWWRTRKPGVLQSIGSEGVRNDWATEQQSQQKFVPLDVSFQKPFPVCLPLATTNLFCVSGLLLFFFLDSAYKYNHTIFVFIWLISIIIMSSKSIHVTNRRISFLS